MTATRAGSLIGLDVGTTAARAVAIDLKGDVLAAASADYPLSTPRPGWVEQDPEGWWAASQAVLHRVMAELRYPPLGLGLTGQMHGAVFLDAGDKVIRPALLWSDQRTARQCEAITEAVGRERLVAITGNPAVTGFQAPKILWLRDEEPAAYARVRRVLLPKDYVRLRLTGEYATDVSDASGTLLLDLRRRSWSAEMLDALEIPREWLPSVYEGPHLTGKISHGVADAVGLPAGLFVAAGGGDNAAAAVGNGVVREGLISSSIGTSGSLFVPSEVARIDPSGRLHAFCHAIPGGYHVLGATLSAGGSLRWWRDASGTTLDYDGMVSSAAQAPPGSEGLIFLPYLAGERTPYLDPLSRGAFFGLNLRHSFAHITRAVMEGVTYSLKDSLDLIANMKIPVTQVRATGGGARSNLWRQLQADIFGLSIYHAQVDEGPAYGAALLAGVACGVYSNVFDACSLIRFDPEVNVPNLELKQLYESGHKTYTDLYAGTATLMHRLATRSGPSSTI